MTPWRVEFRGGSFDGLCEIAPGELGPVLVVWRCDRGVDCEGHGTDNLSDPRIPLAAESYRLVERDGRGRWSLYEIGESHGLDVDRDLVDAGVGGSL